MDPHWPLDAFVHDMLAGPVPGQFDAVYALDVLEHIPERGRGPLHRQFDRLADAHGRRHFRDAVAGIAVLCVAAEQGRSRQLQVRRGVQGALERYFNTVFMFSMNDEVVHTGFYPMAHYLLGVACHRRS